MSPVRSISTCLRKSFTLSGRATRSEFWWFQLFLLIGVLAAFAGDIWLLQIDFDSDPVLFPPLSTTFVIVTLSALATSFSRRFNDIGLPGRLAAAIVVVSQILPFFLPYEPHGLSAMEWLLLALDFSMLAIAILPSRHPKTPDGPNPIEVTP